MTIKPQTVTLRQRPCLSHWREGVGGVAQIGIDLYTKSGDRRSVSRDEQGLIAMSQCA